MRRQASPVVDALVCAYFLFSALTAGRPGAEVEIPAVLVAYMCLRMWSFRDSPEMALLLVYAVSFPAMWIASRALRVQVHYLAANVELRHFAMAFAVQGAFMAALFIGMRGRPPRTIALWKRRDDSVVFWSCVVVTVVALTVAVRATSGSSIFQQAYNFDVSRSSVLFEYVIVLIITAYAYSGESKQKKWILILVCFFAIAAPMLVGRRLPAVMIAVALLLLYWRPKGLIRVLVLASGGFVALSIIGLFRAGKSGSSLTQILFNVESGHMSNNQGGGDYVAAVYVKLVEIGVFNTEFATRSVANVLKSIFLPSSAVDEAAYVNLVATQYIPIPGNGGFPGVHFYIWGGLAGVLIAGFVIGWIISRSCTSHLSAVYVTFLFVVFPRWMGYNVNILIKTGTLLLVGWLILRIVNRAVEQLRDRSAPRKHQAVVEGGREPSPSDLAWLAANSRASTQTVCRTRGGGRGPR